MSAPPVAMVFAAGRGTRMGHLTADRPKPLIEVGGKALLDHALDLLVDGGVRRAVVNTHHHGAMVARHVRTRTAPEIALSPEDALLLETGGGLKAARALLGEAPVLALNADAVWRGPDPVAPLLSPLPPGAARLLLIPRDAAVGHTGPGDFFLHADGRLGRRGDAATAPYVYTGLQYLDPLGAYDRPEAVFSLNRVWDDCLARGNLHGVVYPGQWCDVGRPESLALAEAVLAG